jgi:ABC-2 type transport system ATP-binding protein
MLSMHTIIASELTKSYQVYKKQPGFIGSVKSLFSREYESVNAVKGVSFIIDQGELVGFIGPNGAGKTTTLKMLSGLLYPTSGKIDVLGYTPFDRKHEFLRQISLVMGQKNQLWWDLPAYDSFLLNKEIYGVSPAHFREVVGNLVTLLDVKDVLNIQVRNLSLGQRMKMELIAALIHSPKVLFLDEPTIGLDVVMQKNLREFIRQYNQTYEATIILTSHYMADVLELCKRVIVINHGGIIYDGLLSELMRSHSSYKQLTFVLSKTIEPRTYASIEGVVSYEHPSLVLRIPSNEIQKTLTKCMKTLPIEDMTISDPPIEEIIRTMFQEATQ